MRTPAFATLLPLLACQQDPHPAPADLIFLGGSVVTVDAESDQAEAIATRGDRIVAVGSREGITPLRGPGTLVIELPDDAMVMPGFIEGHGHYMRLGETLQEIDLRNAHDWDEILRLIGAAAENAEPGAWLIGHGWHQGKWLREPEPNIEGLPLHQGLSALTPNNPVLLRHVSGHGLFANAAAMRAADIDDATPDPAGGEIVRDRAGHAFGMMRERAADLVESVFARSRAGRGRLEREAEMREWVQLAGEEALRHGITSFQDLGASFEHIDLWKHLADEGRLPLRMYA